MSSVKEDLLPRTWLYDKKNGFISLEKPSSAYVYYCTHRLNLLTGETSSFCFAKYCEELGELNLIGDEDFYRVLHLFYESAEFFQGHARRPSHFEGPLAVEINYKRSAPYLFDQSAPTGQHVCFEKSSPDYKTYHRGFKKIRRHLINGDAYQVNYTWPFQYHFNRPTKHLDLLARLWSKSENIGAYAHASWIPRLDLLLVSNSPECLFQAKASGAKILLDSMPIKGTTTLLSDSDFGQAWSRLRKSSKERAELNMITDLVRNDLSRIERPRAKVLGSAHALKVPGLLHQYSKVRVELSRNIKLGRVLEAVFPGGSVTGAPKKRVLDIIHCVEKSARGFYCGSTLIMGPKICAASINIRSGEYSPSKGELNIHAGGGVTLGSTSEEEFEEMLAKAASFCQLLGVKTRREKYNNFGRLVF